MWQSFKHYFWTAQIIAGLVMAAKLWKEGPVGMFLAFLAVAPLAAIFALVKAAYDHRRTRPQRP